MGQGGSVSKLQERYFIQKVKLGSGAFGTVWRAVDKQSGTTVALKQMYKHKLKLQKIDMSDVEREVAVMKTCTHDNIMQLLELLEDADCVYLALEYCDCGDLSDKIGERGLDISEVETAGWMRQILAAISALHSENICHRDIKPANFMLKSRLDQSKGSREPPGSVHHILKLADFGLATFHCSDRGLRNTKCGTPHYMAPELHLLPRKSRGYGLPIDVWAAGVSMYAIMFGGQRPFLRNGKFDFSGTVDWCIRKSCFMGLGQLRFSEDARQLCASMLQVDPSKRVTAAQALRTPWLDNACTGKPSSRNPAPREVSPLRCLVDLPGRWGMCVADGPLCVAKPTTPRRHTGIAVSPSSTKLADWDGMLPDVPPEATPTRAEAGSPQRSTTIATAAFPVATLRMTQRRSPAASLHSIAGRRGSASCSSLTQPCLANESSLPATVDRQEGVTLPAIRSCKTQTPGLKEQRRIASSGSRVGSPKVGSAMSAGTARWPDTARQPRLLEALTPDLQRQALAVTRRPSLAIHKPRSSHPPHHPSHHHPFSTHHLPGQPAASEQRPQVPQTSSMTSFATKTELGITSARPSPKAVLEWDIDDEFVVPRPLTLVLPATPLAKSSCSRSATDFAASPRQTLQGSLSSPTLGQNEPEQEPEQHLQSGIAVQDPAQLFGQQQAVQTLHESLQTERNRLAEVRDELAAREQHTEQLLAELQLFQTLLQRPANNFQKHQ